jgi:RHS repeat-associated protein
VPAGGSSGFTATQVYSYDQLNRISLAVETVGGNQSWGQSFGYDRYGNRQFNESLTTTLPKNCVENNSPVMCAVDRKIYNPSINASNDNKLDTSQGYAFDSNGNTTLEAAGQTFIYDSDNKQVEVRNSSNQLVGHYVYDGDGKRVKKVVPASGEVTIFVYDATGKQIAEYSTNILPVEDAEVAYLTADHLGSPRINTDRDGNVTARHDYCPFGEEIVGNGGRTVGLGYVDDSVRKKFTGYERDNETDLDFAQARMYSKSIGRFTTSDPLMASARSPQPQSWNRYTYVWNNPLTLVDPNGMDVKLLDKKAQARVLSTLPKDVRIKVAKQISKDGTLKKGSLDKIKSKDENFQDLKKEVNEEGTIEVMTDNKNDQGAPFDYKTKAEQAAEIRKNMKELGASKAEIAEAIKGLSGKPDVNDGYTLDANQSPSGNVRVVISDGTGGATDEPVSRLAMTTAHELYGHGLPAMKGLPWKHDDGGPVDTRIYKQIEPRTEQLYKPQPQHVVPRRH